MRLHIYILLCILGTALSTACSRLDEPKAPLQIEQKASAPGIRAAATAFVIEQKAYVLFGRNRGRGALLKDFWVYDSQTDSWSTLPETPLKVRALGMAAVVDGKAYVGLGHNGKAYDAPSYLRDFWMFDPSDSTWVRKADYPNHNTNAAQYFAQDHYIYVHFGFFANFTSDMHRYDTLTDTWEECKNAPFTKRTCGASATADNRHFAGFGYRTFMMSDWYEYLPDSDSWIERSKAPQKGRSSLSALSLGKDIYILGGRYFGGTETREEFYEEILRYDTTQDRWSLAGYMPNGGRENMVSFTIGNKAYFGLGENGKGELQNDLYCFTK